MKNLPYFTPIFILVFLVGCDHDEVHVPLNTQADLSFTGTFETVNSEIVSETVTLQISNGYYRSTINLPHGYGAGKLEGDKSTLNFVETLFFPVSALFDPSFVLSGKHQYNFDRENLKIWKELIVGELVYQLQLKRP